MIGDIVTTKLKLKIKYPVLTIEQKNLLNKAISDAFLQLSIKGQNIKCMLIRQHIRCIVWLQDFHDM